MTTALADRLRACADEVMQFPHPSRCDHLHDAATLMREAALVVEERERDREDAERYRWMRTNWFNPRWPSSTAITRAADVEALDAAIDAARSQRGGG
ncbi:MAG: hypothetical protein ACREQF_02210 [Candidatus Binataceae bacterium]